MSIIIYFYFFIQIPNKIISTNSNQFLFILQCFISKYNPFFFFKFGDQKLDEIFPSNKAGTTGRGLTMLTLRVK